MTREELTKESYTNLFEDTFQLTHYSIAAARKRIENGEEDLNVTQLLREIRRNMSKRAERKIES